MPQTDLLEQRLERILQTVVLEQPDRVPVVRDLGPEGFILQSGCDIPPDARLENVKAMMAAATGQ